MITIQVVKNNGFAFPITVRRDATHIKDAAMMLESSSEVDSWRFYGHSMANEPFPQMELVQKFQKYKP